MKIPLKVKWVVLPIFEITEDDEMVFKEADIYEMKRKASRRKICRKRSNSHEF